MKMLSLAGLVVLLVASGVWIALDDSGPTWWDQSRHARNVLAMHDILFSIGRGHTLFEFIRYYDFYPPFSYLPTIFFHAVFGREYDVACLSILLFWIPLLFFSTIGAARYFLVREAAWFAGLVVVTFPVVIGFSKDFMTDIQTAAMTAAGLWALARTNFLLTLRRKRVVVLGVVAGLCLLVKWSMGLYLMGPFLISAIRGLRRNACRWTQNLAVGLAVGIPVAALWYGPNYKPILRGLFTEFQWGDYPPVFSFASFLFYARVLVQDQLFLPLVLLAVTGFMVLAGRRRRFAGFLAVSLGVAYAGLTLIHNKEFRFSMAFLPFVSMALVGWAYSRGRWPWRVVVMAVLFFCGFNLVGVLYRVPGIPPRVGSGFLTLYNHNAVAWENSPSRPFDVARQVELDTRSYLNCRSARRSEIKGIVAIQQTELRINGYRFWYYGDVHGGVVRPALEQDTPMDQPGPAGRPVGPPVLDFSLLPSNAPPLPDLSDPVAHYPSEHDPRGLVLYANSGEPARSTEFPPLAVFTDLPQNSSLCLKSFKVGGSGVRGGTLDSTWDWVVGSRHARETFKYVRVIEARGPAAFALSWLGPTLWDAGDPRTERVQLGVPGDIPAGRYELFLKLLRWEKRKGYTPTRIAGKGFGPDAVSVPVGSVVIK